MVLLNTLILLKVVFLDNENNKLLRWLSRNVGEVFLSGFLVTCFTVLMNRGKYPPWQSLIFVWGTVPQRCVIRTIRVMKHPPLIVFVCLWAVFGQGYKVQHVLGFVTKHLIVVTSQLLHKVPHIRYLHVRSRPLYLVPAHKIFTFT